MNVDIFPAILSGLYCITACIYFLKEDYGRANWYAIWVIAMILFWKL